jgi:D-alanine-D-alanine ligase
MAPTPIRVLHLVGSAVDEHHAELSRLYAADALAVLEGEGSYEPRIAYVHPDRTWSFPADLTDEVLADAGRLPLHAALATLAGDPPDVVVPQLFCGPGMTSYRALFELLEIPSVGNPATVMALAADKAAARALVAQAGVAVPDGQLVAPDGAVSLELPVVVKPVAADNSVGVSLVRTAEELDAALERAWQHGGTALVEDYIELGREVRCGTIVHDGRITALPLEEYAVDPVDKPIRDEADKLGRDPDGRLHLVAKDVQHAWIVDADDPVVPAVQAAAVVAHAALGCRHHGLIDLRIDPDGRPWFLEAGPYCSFGRRSVVPTMAAAAGIPAEQLFAEAVRSALAGHPALEPVH